MGSLARQLLRHPSAGKRSLDASATANIVDEKVDGILLRFKIRNLELVPSEMRVPDGDYFVQETRDLPPGVQFITPTKDVGLAHFFSDLEKAGFVLSNASAQEVIGANNLGYADFAAKFVFHRAPLAVEPSEEHAAWLTTVAAPALEELVGKALWETMAHKNQGFGKREGRTGISLAMRGRRPLVDGQGKPFVEYEKDSRGNRIGDKPRPISAKHYLRLVEGRVVLA